MANPNWQHSKDRQNIGPAPYGAPRPDVGPNPYGQYPPPGQYPGGQWGQPAPGPAPHQGGWQQNQQTVQPWTGRVPDASQAFMTKVFGWMTMGLGLTAIVAWLTYSTGLFVSLLPFMWGLLIAELALVFGLSFGLRRMSAPVAIGAFLLYAGLNGLTLSVIFAAYTMASIASVFLVTTMTFGFMFVYGWTTKKDLTSLGSLLFMGLIGLIIASVVNMFVGGTAMSLAISVLGVLIFVGLTAYDAQKIKQIGAYGFADSETEHKSAIMGALALYLDFINLFLHLLRLLGDRR